MPASLRKLSTFIVLWLPRHRPTGRSRGTTATTPQAAKSNEADLLPGSVSRLNAFVPESAAQIENLYHELLAQAETPAQGASRGTHCPSRANRNSAQVTSQELTPTRPNRNSHKRQVASSALTSQTEARTSHVEELTGTYREIGQLASALRD